MVEAVHIPDATTEPDAYVAALLDTLGDRDPVEVYAATPEEVRRLCGPLDATGRSTPPAPGEWSVGQVIGHLFDVDIVYGFRWRLVLTAERPFYPGYDEKAWSRLARPETAAVLDAFTALRHANLALARSFTAADWHRYGVHGEQGDEDLRRMTGKIAGHDLAHLNQLRLTVDAVRRP